MLTRRYFQSDPIGIDARINSYAYAGNNPVRNVDPAREHLVARGIVAKFAGDISGAQTSI
ncbi:MAG: RHS repeat-associated core domain-containing protein [Burkholderiales bacterium]